jgi:hypothetical protein
MGVRGHGVWVAAALAAVALGCGEREVHKDAEEAAEALRDNPPEAAGVYEETYEQKRKQGEGRIEASGDAYDAVLEVPKERAEAKQ